MLQEISFNQAELNLLSSIFSSSAITIPMTSAVDAASIKLKIDGAIKVEADPPVAE